MFSSVRRQTDFRALLDSVARDQFFRLPPIYEHDLRHPEARKYWTDQRDTRKRRADGLVTSRSDRRTGKGEAGSRSRYETISN